jgi:ParB-like chromosome segregation protein Spo0J
VTTNSQRRVFAHTRRCGYTTRPTSHEAKMKRIPVSEIKVGERFRKDLGKIGELAKSIYEIGLIQPIVVDPNNELVAGGRRLAAVQLLEWDDVPVVVFDGDALRGQEDENERRKAFTISERTAIAEAVKRAIDSGKVTVPEGVKKATFIAKEAGFDSHATHYKAMAVVEKGTPELVEAVDAGVVSVSAAAELADAPPEVQKEAAKAGKKGAAKAAGEVRKGKAESKKKDKAEPVKQEKDEPKGNPVLMDGLGNPVPDCVADAFGDPALGSLLTLIESGGQTLRSLLATLKDVTRKSDAWPFAHFGKAQVSLSDAIDKVRDAWGQIKAGVPFCVCQNCKGNGCPLCGSSGYQTHHMYENPEQYGGE